MHRLIRTAAVAAMMGSLAFSASAHGDYHHHKHGRHGVNVHNTWSGVNGSTRNHNSSWRYKTGVDFTTFTHGGCKGKMNGAMPWHHDKQAMRHDAPPPRVIHPARVSETPPPPPPAKSRWFWKN